MKHSEHEPRLLYFPLDLGSMSKIARSNVTPESFLEGLKDALKEYKHPKHCPTCGALKFELGLDDGQRTYYFTCYEIKDNKTGDIIAETDYKKFGEYCTQRNRSVTRVITK